MKSYNNGVVSGVLWASIVVALFTLVGAAFATYIAYADSILTLAPISSPSVTKGNTVSFTANATFTDATSSTISYSLSGAPDGATIDPSSGVFSWNTVDAVPGTFTFTVIATGSAGGSDTKQVSIIVNPAAVNTHGSGGETSETGGTIITSGATSSVDVGNDINTNTVNPDQGGVVNGSNLTADNTNEAALDTVSTTTAETGDNSILGNSVPSDVNCDPHNCDVNTIVTGNAVSTANVINEVNTNIFNSTGLMIFINQLFGGGFNLEDYLSNTNQSLSYFFAGGPGASPNDTLPGTNKQACTLLTCLVGSSLNVFNNNNAAVTNSVIVRSSSGSNIASSTGDSVIDTGDAYAAANVINLVNTNIVNSSYLMLSFNNFGDLHDNITLPDADFFTKLMANGGKAPTMKGATATSTNTNVATTTGIVATNATTGDNSASSTTNTGTTTPSGDGFINTGNAHAASNSFNQVNTNDIYGTSIFMLFRISGTWSHNISDINLPPGLSATTTSNGDIEVVSNDSSGAAQSSDTCTYEYRNSNTGDVQYSTSHDDSLEGHGYRRGDLVGGPCLLGKGFLASSTNNAILENNINVVADTGHNDATTDTGTAYVNTGNAYAVANVVNLVNTNIVGQNWIFAVFNIFGNWDGNIKFGGSPSFSVVATPSVTNAAPGDAVTYTFTVTNTGTGDANKTSLIATFPTDVLSFDNTSGATSTPTGAQWSLGKIARGQSQTFTYTAHVANNIAFGSGNGQATVPLTAAVVNDDGPSLSPSDTADTHITVNAPVAPPSNGGGGPSGGGSPSGGGGGGAVGMAIGAWTPDPKVAVTKSVWVTPGDATTTANYTVVVTNEKTAGPAYNGMLTDTLTDPSGNVMYTRSWDLDAIMPGDEIDLTYSVAFVSTSTPGIYHNVAEVTGNRNYNGVTYGNPMTPVDASGDVEFTTDGRVTASSTVPVIKPKVLGVSTSTVPCIPLITTFIKKGSKTNSTSDVFKLQAFLNSNQKAHLTTNGTYDAPTISAVNQFQVAYAADILAPWGLTKPTSNVYLTTQREINSIACNDSAPFTLTPDQVKEIGTFSASHLSKTTHAAVKPAATAKKAAPTTAVAPVLPPVVLTPVTMVDPKPTTKNTQSKDLGSSISSWLKSALPFAHAAEK